MKGKAAVQNANRRTAEAIERADRLAAELAAERAARQVEVRDLAEQIRQLRNEAEQEAERRAADKVASATAEATRSISATQEEFREKATASVLELLSKLHNNTMRTEDIITVAERFGVQPDDTWSAIDSTRSRYARRITWTEYRKNLRRLDQDKRMNPARMRKILGEVEDGSR